MESAAIVQRRLGTAASRALFDQIVPVLEIVFVDEVLHTAAIKSWLTLGTRKSSLVDWVSFELIRRRAVQQAFVFDQDFAPQSIEVVPES